MIGHFSSKSHGNPTISGFHGTGANSSLFSIGIGAFGRRGTAVVHFCKNKSHNSLFKRVQTLKETGRIRLLASAWMKL